jgi:hypothetical protein
LTVPLTDWITTVAASGMSASRNTRPSVYGQVYLRETIAVLCCFRSNRREMLPGRISP